MNTVNSFVRRGMPLQATLNITGRRFVYRFSMGLSHAVSGNTSTRRLSLAQNKPFTIMLNQVSRHPWTYAVRNPEQAVPRHDQTALRGGAP